MSAEVEASHFLMLTAMMPAVSLLAAPLGRLRSRLQQQKLELQQALERIRFMAARDELTGLLNRRPLGKLMTQTLARAQRQGLPRCIALIDLDHFKRINEAHGHAASNEVVREFALEGLRRVRGSDTLARWCDEEFMLLMPTCSFGDARGRTKPHRLDEILMQRC